MGIIIGPTCRGCCVWIKRLSKVTKVNHTHGHCTQKSKIKMMSFCMSPKATSTLLLLTDVCNMTTVYDLRGNLCPSAVIFLVLCFSPPPLAQSATDLLSVSIQLPILDISCKWNYIGPFVTGFSH